VGATSSFTVRINAAQTTNTEVALESSNPPVLQVPASVTVAQGAVSATFTRDRCPVRVSAERI
jgi:hypothetical protein